MAKENAASMGIITSRRCPVCGHHEIGFTSQDGSFHPLTPGTRIQILDSADTNPAEVGHNRNQDHEEGSGD